LLNKHTVKDINNRPSDTTLVY